MEQNKAKERFTKTWAIEQHRKMWHWIADQIQNGELVDIGDIWQYKRKYMKERYHRYFTMSRYYYCFCCLFAKREKERVNKENCDICIRCYYCPLKLGGCADYQILGEIGVINTEEKRQYAIQLCEQIAEAPERKV